jgi:tetratricopeptide (TPR) repeat protein
MKFYASVIACALGLAVWATPAAADYYDDAVTAAKAKDYATAIKLYSEALDKNALEGRRLYAVLTNRGQAYLKAGKRTDAIADFTRVFEMTNIPDTARFGALLNRGGAHSSFNDHKRALADYNLLIKTWRISTRRPS